ncbi:prolipoprotein diacylglyceryl transferase [Anaerostipes sp. MSJ-23]|uniref:prolipoprotein diacylglyceryl transferase n=1 Tax=unclassified Anaerostipes TaxID=2635253 RepID=UPI001C1253E7|nr:prolipoprotein diacylglyceryl transferase [Anaerostipes sp. MSJ-23]MBU5459756.1 prolipoprotein diacylglyceryl transferase [Anaerostipes sp. MSJ-23]
MEHEIRFPHLGIVLKNVGDGFNIGGFEIKYYGIMIALGFLFGMIVAYQAAKHTKDFDPELVFDYLIWMVIPAIVGARLYYVIFSWDYYGKHPGEIFAIRNGGLAIYGGILASILVLFIFCKVRKVSMMKFADIAVKGLLVGQILGRWGNFFNREAFGRYTDSLFAMQIPTDFFVDHGRMGEIIKSGVYNTPVYLPSSTGDAITYIQVHPTFLYEGLWNLALLIFIIWFTKRKTFDGQLLAIYLAGYGIGRFWIEGLRTDSLMLGGTGIRVSQLLAAILALIGIGAILYQTIRRKRMEK